MDEKKCTKCQSVKAEGDFYVRRKKGEVVGRQAWCKSCMREQNRAWTEKNRARVKYHDRKKMLQARYGPGMHLRYELLMSAQAGRCAICGEHESKTDRADRVYRLAVDHDHETGEVRGLLCSACNQALGSVGDNIAGVKRLLNYLENPPNADLPADLETEKWTKHYSACMECETTTTPHGGGGLCRNCYMRKARREGKPWVKDVPWEERKKRGALSPSKRPRKGESPAG